MRKTVILLALLLLAVGLVGVRTYHDLRPGEDGLWRTPPVVPSLYRLFVFATPGGSLIPAGMPLAALEGR